MKKLLFLFIFGSSLFTLSAQTWSALGTGITDSSHSNYPEVNALTVYQGNLIAAGFFDSAGGINANCVAQWNGTAWDSMAGGVARFASPPYTFVNALTTYKNNLVAGGFWVAYALQEWNGSKWFDSCGDVGLFWPYCHTCVPYVAAFTTYNGNLIVGGQFTSAPGAGKFRNIGEVVNNNSWLSMNEGTDFFGLVNALTVYNGYLIAGGLFDSVGGIKAKNIGAWNGTSWSVMGTGIHGHVYALAVINGYLIAGGAFDSAGGQSAKNIAMWDGGSWRPIGSGVNGAVNALTTYNNYLVIGGTFDSAGGIKASNIAEWLWNRWYPLGAGTNNGVYAMAVMGSNLYVGGSFTTAGGNPANCVAEWNQPLGVNELSLSGNDVELYPNPNTGQFNLVIASAAKQSHSIIEIYNMLGEKIYSRTFNIQNSAINIAGSPSGIYLYRVTSETGELLGEGKFVIEK